MVELVRVALRRCCTSGSAVSIGVTVFLQRVSPSSRIHLARGLLRGRQAARHVVPCDGGPGLDAVRAGFETCAVFYGHPGASRSRHMRDPARASRGVQRPNAARHFSRGLPVRGSGVEPGAEGCQSFEASNFLISRRRFDPTSALILWQVGLLGEFSVRPKMASRPERLRILTDTLRRHYPARHPVVLTKRRSSRCASLSSLG